MLADDVRARFASELFQHVLGVLAACELDGVLVATDGDDVEKLARLRGAYVRRDNGGSALASVIDRALVDVASRGASAAVVLMADLPRIEPRDVRHLLASLDTHDVVLVADHLGHHTNALAIAPPTAMVTCFGRGDSFAAHCAAARQANLRVDVVDNERIAFDVDLPEDHVRLGSEAAASSTTRWPPGRPGAGT